MRTMLRVLRSGAQAVSLVAFLGLSSTGANAGPFNDFEKALAAAYAPYRAALMQTNQKDKAATEQSLQAFGGKWAELMKTYKTAPPPQYADDPKWPETIGSVEQMISAAKNEAAKGDLVKAHNVLEGVRVQLGHLRSRNGVITFSDRMDAYHEKMEQILASTYGGYDIGGIGALREDVTVLAHLAQLLPVHAPAAFGQEPSFKEALAGLNSSIDALQTAARKGDKPSIEKAIQGLKGPYAKMFVKYG